VKASIRIFSFIYVFIFFFPPPQKFLGGLWPNSPMDEIRLVDAHGEDCNSGYIIHRTVMPDGTNSFSDTRNEIL
jgi:hypothetical protein